MKPSPPAGLLARLSNPGDVRKLSPAELAALSEEVRQRINEVVRETGGHLGPNLGAVELITALHSVFDFSVDRLVFDVGHQAYAHKILTGRNPAFLSLRQKDGVSGYPHPEESVYDTFRGGHASTSISTALGLLEANPPGSERKVVAIIGDGSLTGGMAFEGLNHAGHLGKNLIVVVNDNSMSISPTVGALSSYFNKIRHLPPVQRIGNDVTEFVSRLPRFGGFLRRLVKLLSRQSRHLLNPGQFFIDLGFDYLGPLDGHDLEELTRAFRIARNSKGPILVHVLTQKGRGYRVDGPDGEARIGPHALSPGQRKKEEASRDAATPSAPAPLSWSAAFGRNLVEIAEKDSRVRAITAAMEEGTSLEVFRKNHPGRIYDVGICEQHAMGFTAGLAASGARPVFAVYSTFLQRAIDQVFHDVVLQGELPVLLCIDRGGLVGDDGPSHHGLYDIGYLRVFPTLVQMSPRDEAELRAMMDWALAGNLPCAIRYPRDVVPPADLYPPMEPIVLGRPQILRKGSRVAVLAYGPVLRSAWQALESLAAEGILPTLVNARFAKPLAPDFLAEIREDHDVLVTVEEGALAGGFGSGVLEAASDARIAFRRVLRLGVPDRLIEHASRAQQLAECGLDSAGIARTIRSGWTD